MSEEVEQITKDPLPAKSGTKEKDQKKVAAGKKLAENNRKAREALAREIKREEEAKREAEAEAKREEEAHHEEGSPQKAWFPELSFTTVLSIVGIGFTAVDMFMRYYKNRESQVPTRVPDPQTSKIPVPKPTSKIGMQ